MSSNAPPPGNGGPPWGQDQPGVYPTGDFGPGAPAGPGEYLVGGPAGEPPYQQPQTTRRGLKSVIIATVLAMFLGGGALAFYQLGPLSLFRAGPQAAEAVPADALFYVGVDLEPAAEQKVAALRFLNHFPAFREGAGIGDVSADVRKLMFEALLADSNCNVTYDDDVAPWIGGKLGFAGVAGRPGTSAPKVMLAVEVTDAQRAGTGLKALQNCAGRTAGGALSFGFDFTGDYALLAETQSLAEKFAASAADSSLADSDTFTSDMESLGDLGVATVWADVSKAVDLFAPPSLAGGQIEFLRSMNQRAAATIRFSSDSMEVVTSTFGQTPSFAHGDNQIVDLPESTVFAMSEAGGRNRLDASWDDIMRAVESQGGDVDAQITRFEAETGLAVPEDLATLLGDNVMVAVDAKGLTGAALWAGDPSLLNAGVRFTSDPDELSRIYDKVLRLLEQEAQQSLPLVKHEVGDGIVVATKDDYAERLAGLGGGLGDTAEFQLVTDDAASKEFVLFFNWDSVEQQILQAGETAGAPQDLVDNLRPLRAFGITSGIDGDYTITTMRLSVND